MHRDARQRVGSSRDAGIAAREAEPGVELAAPRGGIEVAGGIVVDADLLAGRCPVALEARVLHVDGGLEQAVAASGAPARDAQRRDHLPAGGRALAPGRSVGGTVVALLATFGDAVAAPFQAARRCAAVAGDVVAVVALLTQLDLAVAADRGVRRAPERDLVRRHPRAEAVMRAQ